MKNIVESITCMAGKRGGGYVIAEDVKREPVTYRALLTRVGVLAALLSTALPSTPLASGGRLSCVGILLPTSLGATLTFLALHQLGKVPAMLNFSSGAKTIAQMCETTELTTILTSRVFIKKAGLEALADELQQHYTLIYLEDLRKNLTLSIKLKAAWQAFSPKRFARSLPNTKADDVAVILFTSGSEGTPKGVALSHKNLLTNIEQVSKKLEFSERDVMFNALPIFHSFGLTVGTLLPLTLGFKTFLYPSPLDYKVIPPLIEEVGATIMLGTDTFFRGYANYASEQNFKRLRLCVAGAEKLKGKTIALYQDKFGLDILQGYGVTEASPVISCNRPEANKAGSVGQCFEGIETKLEPVEGIERGGRLFVKGDNIMLGYLLHDKCGQIQPQSEWYDTGDIVEIDAQGFIHIVGRAKRFAKIGGEMVSLTALEEFVHEHWPDACHAAVAKADERKGEQIILVSEQAGLERSDIVAQAKAQGIAEIMIPKQVVFCESVPLLGSGKVDYVGLVASSNA